MKDIEKIIMDEVEDLVINFVYYDRKEDDELSLSEFKKAINENVVSIDDIVSKFKHELTEELKNQ